ncbi:AN1-type zinc finger protein 4 isoform X2 [Callithrix jacchus]|uniref:Zinc finger AN1-type containing 4 n=2 Tax=Callithrix jacchus TaxID=9483 RepID=F7G7Q1_CALJA|nr:AN1-type zinc finger protein 4 isoform X2 [Callithrix jacchus]XP_035123535.1 AN1-type zinc finger protein 4 isoform X2 [Callithrix jacchus]XP_035123536.1 AN1-type zinc finger protein 4 isoform X2 [Callithrix jacchus]XP_035123537.1 AN1-type zinc finger protein 4 isoform X2 [Callithrix jacchus]XP_035123538.1 AN1-type zinc finger protein 4 isoform X2 [Callithrix jacchus]
MDNRKEPPFFNDDNMGPFYYRLHFYDTVELFIETLTGTCFQLRVSPFEAVISVKAKIQRLEGIPICQQHLIWNNMELEDDYCLNNYNISEGCTLKLVLALRGGPINTRKVPTEDPLREMAEYLDSSQDEIWEKISCNKQVTFLVYRERDQLNFFRVVDRGDGTLTPLSESLSGGSTYNLYTDEDEETEPSPSGQQIIENSITMNKMKLLKAKMKNMNLSKKPKKAVKVKPHPPIAPRPSSGSTAPSRHRLLRVLPNIGQSCLPSLGNTYLPETSRNAISNLVTQLPAERPISSITGEFLKEDDNWKNNTLSPSSSSVKLPPQIPHLELRNDEELADSVLHLGSSLPRQTKHFVGNLPSSNKKDTVLLPPTEECVTEESLLPEVGSLASFAEGKADEQNSGLEGACKVNPELLLTNADKRLKAPEQHLKHVARVLNGESVEASVLNYRELSPHKNRLLSPLHCSAPRSLHNSLVKPQRQSKCFESGKLQSSSQNVFQSLDVRNITDSSFSATTRFLGVKVDSPGKRSDVISKVEARDITEMVNKASKEPVGCVNNISFLASLARSTSRDSFQSTRGAGRLRTPGIGLSTNLQHFQEENLRKSSPQLEHTEFFFSTHGIGMNGNNAAAGKRVGECTTHHLPPVKAPPHTKKKTTNHCFLCGKKTGLVTSYECRCGNNFCASHRYAETHGCTYDYKSAGRRYLQEANPVVNAPKLPKI